MNKDKAYWREYNQKRKEYMKNLMRIKRAQTKVANNNSQISVANISEMVANRIKVANTVANNQKNKIVVDLEAYNQEVYKRDSVLTKDPKAFFTFPDGRKIVRPKCGCNPIPNKDPKEWSSYTWCLDFCKYFTWWREQALDKIHE